MKSAQVACMLFVLLIAPVTRAQDVPNTLDEAFSSLDRTLSVEQRDDFSHKPEAKAVIDAHMGLGAYIRNNWFRAGHSKLADRLRNTGAQALDDVSSMVLVSYWRHLNGVPIRLAEQGSCYRRWWDEQRRLEAASQGSGSYSVPRFSCL
jgi:hypothetical protein